MENRKMRGKYGCCFYTFEMVVSKVCFELTTTSSFHASTEPAVYEVCSLKTVLKLPRHVGLVWPDPNTVALLRS